ncbi:MAG: GNAT family N-acetyltransferase [Hydrogenophilales bacterium]|nr:GNAT family N-acetyltransferase [Hydrogenophilales bacterium]
MRIRLATAADLDAMIELIGMLFTLEPDNVFEPAKARRGRQMLLGHPDNAAVWVADQDGTVVGMCSAQIVISTAEGGPSAWIEDLIAAPALRGQGIGRQLLDAVAAWAARRGLTRLQLLADQHNQAALDFYRHMDWQGTRLICLRHYPGVTS